MGVYIVISVGTFCVASDLVSVQSINLVNHRFKSATKLGLKRKHFRSFPCKCIHASGSAVTFAPDDSYGAHRPVSTVAPKCTERTECLFPSHPIAMSGAKHRMWLTF